MFNTGKLNKCISACILLLAAASGCSSAEGESPNVSSAQEGVGTQPPGTINVLSATFGINCGVSRGNATSSLASQCDGQVSCGPSVGYYMTGGDPAHGCDKDFDADFACGTVNTLNSGRLSVHVPREANGKEISGMDCGPMASTGIISVQDASYGFNINTNFFGNADWDVQPYCNGWGHCKYFVSSATLGDPARGKDKTFEAHYTCSNNPGVLIPTGASAEANGQVVSFDCP